VYWAHVAVPATAHIHIHLHITSRMVTRREFACLPSARFALAHTSALLGRARLATSAIASSFTRTSGSTSSADTKGASVW